MHLTLTSAEVMMIRMMMMMHTLTFTDKEGVECEDDCVPTVQEITTHHM